MLAPKTVALPVYDCNCSSKTTSALNPLVQRYLLRLSFCVMDK